MAAIIPQIPALSRTTDSCFVKGDSGKFGARRRVIFSWMLYPYALPTGGQRLGRLVVSRMTIIWMIENDRLRLTTLARCDIMTLIDLAGVERLWRC